MEVPTHLAPPTAAAASTQTDIETTLQTVAQYLAYAFPLSTNGAQHALTHMLR